jgi:hypothetical protein
MRSKQMNSKKVILIVGYIGVAIVFLSSAAYSLQVTLNPNSAAGILAVTFCLINLIAWSVGYYARQNPQTEDFGVTLLVLGDVIFPLNLYAPFFLYVFLLKGNIFHSFSAVLLIGIAYHLMGYMRHERRRFSILFYPYFFAVSVGTFLYLTRFTLNLSAGIIVWLIIGFALVFQILSAYANLQPRKHFSFATLALLLGTAIVTCLAFIQEPRGQYLLAFFVIAAILFWLAWTTRNLAQSGRYFGLAFLSVLTIFFTAWLYYFDSSPALYVISTTVWVCILTMLGIFLKDYKYYPFQEAAHWLSVFLGLVMIIYWGSFWATLAKIHFQLPFDHALTLPLSFQLKQQVALLTPISLLAISIAFLSGSYYKRRYPTIALSKAGFIFNISLITLTSYLPLLLFVAVSTGIWLCLFAEVYGAALVPLVFAIVYLFISKKSHLLFPVITLKVAGFIAIFISALTAFFSIDLAILVFSGSSLIFLWRSVNERSPWLHISFLAFLTIAATLAAMRAPGQKGLLVLSLLSVVLVVVYRWLRFGLKMHFESRATLFWAFLLGVTVVIVEGVWGHFSPVVFLPLWLGLLIAFVESKEQSPWEPNRDFIDRRVIQQFKRLKMVGFWLAHLSGAAWLMAMLQACELPAGFTGIALAVWAWAHLGLCYALTARTSDDLALITTRRVIHAFALLSLLVAALNWAQGTLSVVAVFLVAALYIFLRFVQKNRALEDMAAFSLIEAFYLLGISLKIGLSEYYLSLFGLYLCFLLFRKAKTLQPVTNVIKRNKSSIGRFKMGLRFIWKNLLPITIILIMVAYPVWAFSKTLENTHIYYMGAATVALLYLFLISRQQTLLIFVLCIVFVQGAVYLLIFGEPGERVNLFLVLVGTLIIVNQIFVHQPFAAEFSNAIKTASAVHLETQTIPSGERRTAV